MQLCGEQHGDMTCNLPVGHDRSHKMTREDGTIQGMWGYGPGVTPAPVQGPREATWRDRA